MNTCLYLIESLSWKLAPSISIWNIQRVNHHWKWFAAAFDRFQFKPISIVDHIVISIYIGYRFPKRKVNRLHYEIRFNIYNWKIAYENMTRIMRVAYESSKHMYWKTFLHKMMLYCVYIWKFVNPVQSFQDNDINNLLRVAPRTTHIPLKWRSATSQQIHYNISWPHRSSFLHLYWKLKRYHLETFSSDLPLENNFLFFFLIH